MPEFHICKDGKGAEAVIGWGLRPTTHKARAFAAEHQLPFIALEDGFLRSLGLGVAGYPPYSIVYDDIGIYYDTTRPSRLEQLILAADTMPSETLAQAQQTMDFILQHHLSKYNHAPNFQTIILYAPHPSLKLSSLSTKPSAIWPSNMAAQMPLRLN